MKKDVWSFSGFSRFFSSHGELQTMCLATNSDKFDVIICMFPYVGGVTLNVTCRSGKLNFAVDLN